MSSFPFRVVASELVLELSSLGFGGAIFVLTNVRDWSWVHFVCWFLGIVFALEIIARLCFIVGPIFSKGAIVIRGKHLDSLALQDIIFITFSKCCIPVFSYHLLYFCWHSGKILWNLNDVSLKTIVIPYLAYFIIFDLFYSLFHRLLHHPSIYKYIHKHHHRQMAPTRGNIDAINVHPVEFVGGEYNYLFTVFLWATFVAQPHILSVLLFIISGATLASLNHTRYDVQFFGLYQVRYHDIHHWFPDANFGQHIMLWDHVFRSFKPYPEDTKPSKAK